MEDNETEDSLSTFCARHFCSSEKNLVGILVLLRSYQVVLQANFNFASLFGIPLESDRKATGLGALFSTPKPRILNAEQTRRTSLEWKDVVSSTKYGHELQKDGSYHVRVDDNDQTVVELSKGDHDFIATGLPRQLIDPQLYPSDVASERAIALTVTNEISRSREMVLQVLETMDSVLDGICKKLNLQSDLLASDISGNELRVSKGNESTATSKESVPSPAKNGKKRKRNGGNPWTFEETEYLCKWYVENQNLSKDEIEKHYRFKGRGRTFSSIQSKLYEKKLGHLTHKKKMSPESHVASEPLTSLPTPLHILSPSTNNITAVDGSQLSLAINIIRESYDKPCSSLSSSGTSEGWTKANRTRSWNGTRSRGLNNEPLSALESEVNPASSRSETSRIHKDSGNTQTLHEDPKTDTPTDAINSKKDTSAIEVAVTCQRSPNPMNESLSHPTRGLNSPKETDEEQTIDLETTIQSPPPIIRESTTDALPGFSSLIGYAESVCETGSRTTKELEPNSSEAMHFSNVRNVGHTSGPETSENTPNRDRQQLDDPKTFANSAQSVSQNPSSEAAGRHFGSVGCVNSHTTAPALKRASDVGATPTLPTISDLNLELPTSLSEQQAVPVIQTPALFTQRSTYSRIEHQAPKFLSDHPRPSESYFQLGNVARQSQLQSYVCQTCNKSFAQKWKLDDHMNLHMGLKPYGCSWPGCSATFSNRGSRTRHQSNCRPDSGRPGRLLSS